MKKDTIQFLTLLLWVLAIVFSIHLLIRNTVQLPVFGDRIMLSYLINYGMAAAILIIIKSRINKKSSHTGFIFLGGSGFKFLVFFLVFFPFYQADNTLSTSEFAAFFVPYATCLILEVAYLSKQLNNQEF